MGACGVRSSPSELDGAVGRIGAGSSGVIEKLAGSGPKGRERAVGGG